MQQGQEGKKKYTALISIAYDILNEAIKTSERNAPYYLLMKSTPKRKIEYASLG